MKEEQAVSIVQEILMPIFAIILFPILTIRALYWNWFLWLRNSSQHIQDFKKGNKNKI